MASYTITQVDALDQEVTIEVTFDTPLTEREVEKSGDPVVYIKRMTAPVDDGAAAVTAVIIDWLTRYIADRDVISNADEVVALIGVTENV